jgi:hypothetical protein
MVSIITKAEHLKLPMRWLYIMSYVCVMTGNVTVNILVHYCGAELWNRDLSRRTVRPYFLITPFPSFPDLLLLLLQLLVRLFYEEHYLYKHSTYWTFSIWTANLSPFRYVSFFICKPAVCVRACVWVCVCIYIYMYIYSFSVLKFACLAQTLQ